MAASHDQDATPAGSLLRMLRLLPLLILLAACGGGAGQMSYSPLRASYPQPGPPDDPWRPYIRDAASRFSIPQQWIRAVMHQESGGHEYLDGQPIVSGAGAMGLMQLMPATYADLKAQYDLGRDPFEPHDNILAGTAYIRQMYQKYGAPAFLAAYNAGPQRLEDYLYDGRTLPNETVNYVASIAPNLGTEIAMTGPLATYAGGGSRTWQGAAPVRLAAYRVPARRRRGRVVVCWRDPDAAYDPDAPCQAPPPESEPGPVQVASFVPARSAIGAPAVTLARAPMPAPPYGGWAIQVGAYNSVDQARFATTMARQADFARLAGSQSIVQPTTPFGQAVLYRARLAGLARADAGSACAALRSQNIPCMVVTPGG